MQVPASAPQLPEEVTRPMLVETPILQSLGAQWAGQSAEALIWLTSLGSGGSDLASVLAGKPQPGQRSLCLPGDINSRAGGTGPAPRPPPPAQVGRLCSLPIVPTQGEKASAHFLTLMAPSSSSP